MTVILNTLYITTPDAYLRLEGETICVIIDNTKKSQIPLHHLSSLVLMGDVMISPALMGRCMEDGRSIVWLNRNGQFRARVEGPVSGNILLRQAQYRAADDEQKTKILAAAFLAGKLRNSRNVLLRGARETESECDKVILIENSQLILRHLRKLACSPDLDSLRGEEGNSAKIYFQSLQYLLRPGFRSIFHFEIRSRRPPLDAFNALLSFLYAIVLHDCRAALESVGLDPQLGFLHVPRPGRPALALDLLEEFRSVIADRLVLTLINRGQIKESQFIKRDGGAVLLDIEVRKAVILAYQKRKQEVLHHPLIDKSVPVGLLPHIQARMLARYLRGDSPAYVPYLHR